MSNDTTKLISRAKDQHDQQAYAELYQKYKGLVYSQVLGMLKQDDQVDDIVIEVFTKAFKNLHQYQPTGSFKSWITSIARNHTLDFFRKKNTKAVSLDDDTNSITEVEDDSQGVLQDIIKEEEIASLRHMIEALKPKYRTLIELRYYEEKSYDEIAEIVALPLGTVKAQLFRARALLSEIIQNRKNNA